MKKINSNLFKKSISKFSTGVTIITIKKDNEYIGKTVNSFTSLSLDPPLILFSLGKKSSSINIYKNSTFLGINMLSKKQKFISQHFSSKKPKWENIKFFISKNDIPMIYDCVVNLSCKLIKVLSEGDHIIFICKISEVLIDDKKKPLVYFNSKYI